MPRKFDVAVLHDYFVDRLVHLGSIAKTVRLILEKKESGGGGLHGFTQEEVLGGNAVNLARALGRLGLRVLLITHSDEDHRWALQRAFEGLDVKLNVKEAPAGLTVALEERVNVMLGHGGGAADFGPGALDEEDWEGMRSSRVVCSVNWAANRRGTELLLSLRKRLGKEKTIFLDPADFRDRLQDFGLLLSHASRRHLLDWVSMNQYEGAAAAGILGVGTEDRGRTCQEMARKMGVVFDLHGMERTYSSEGTRVASAVVRKIRPARLTGAGDAWDAGAIYGRLKGMEEVPRLEFANTAAKLYLMSENLVPPTADQVRRGSD